MADFTGGATIERGNTSLSITSLLDVLTIILIFLLVNYSDEFQDVKTPKYVQLPAVAAASAGDPSDHIMVSIGENRIDINGHLIKFSSFSKQKWKVLSEAATHLDMAARKKKNKKNRVMTIQADKDVSYYIIESILTQASSVGITQIEFVALKQQS